MTSAAAVMRVVLAAVPSLDTDTVRRRRRGRSAKASFIFEGGDSGDGSGADDLPPSALLFFSFSPLFCFATVVAGGGGSSSRLLCPSVCSPLLEQA